MTLSKTSVQRIDLDDLERQLREVAVSSLPKKDDPLAELARIVGREAPLRAVTGGRGQSPAAQPAAGSVTELGSAANPAGLDLADAVLATEDIALLTQASERSLMRLLAQYPRVVEQAAVAREPHRITFYLYDVAGELNGLWTKSKDSADLRFVNANSRNLTAARLALLTGVRNVLASGLALIGVSAPREMR